MFNKTNKQSAPTIPQPAAFPYVDQTVVEKAETSAESTPTLSAIGNNMVIDGNVTVVGDLHLSGTIRGNVKAHNIIVNESGNIEGKVEANNIEIRGRVIGTISGQQVKILAAAFVEGDISHEQLAIDMGASFQGRCLQNHPASQ